MAHGGDSEEKQLAALLRPRLTPESRTAEEKRRWASEMLLQQEDMEY